MDKFDIHKWQREAYTTLNEDTSILTPGTKKVYDQIVEIYDRHVKKLPMNSDDDINLKRALCEAFDYKYFCNEDKSKVTTEEAGTNKDLGEISKAIEPIAVEFVETLRDSNMLEQFKQDFYSAENKLNIQIPDSKAEISNMNPSQLKAEIEQAAKLKNELENLSEDSGKKFREVLGTVGLSTVVGASFAEVASTASAILAPQMLAVGIFIMAVAIALESYSNKDDKNLEEGFSIWRYLTNQCPDCKKFTLRRGILGLYAVCRNPNCNFDAANN